MYASSGGHQMQRVRQASLEITVLHGTRSATANVALTPAKSTPNGSASKGDFDLGVETVCETLCDAKGG